MNTLYFKQADPAGDSEENDPAEMKRLFYVTRQCMRVRKENISKHLVSVFIEFGESIVCYLD